MTHVIKIPVHHHPICLQILLISIITTTSIIIIIIIVVHYHLFLLEMYVIVLVKYHLKLIRLLMVLEFVIVPQNLISLINRTVIVHHQSMPFDQSYQIDHNKIKFLFLLVQMPVALKDKVLHFIPIILNVIYLIILLL